jgi:hypothetical protein
LGDSFVLTLTAVRRAEWRGRGGSGPASAIREGIEINETEIVGTQSGAMPITIETTLGHIILDFQSIRCALDTGQASDYQAIYKVYEEYWEEEWREGGRFYKQIMAHQPRQAPNVGVQNQCANG